MICHCTDPECRECGGGCTEDSALRVYRIGKDTDEGTPMCEQCADEACRSGTYSEDPAEL